MNFVAAVIGLYRFSYFLFNKVVFYRKISIYLLSMLFITGIRRIIIVMMALELLSWLFSSLMRLRALKYLLVQSYFVFLLIILVLALPGAVWFCFLLKSGLPPLHAWFFYISFNLTVLMFLVFSTFHKILPLAFLSKSLMGQTPIVALLYIMASILLFQVSIFYYVIFCSSLVHRRWILFSFFNRTYFFLMYVGLYIIFMVSLLARLGLFNFLFLTVSQSSYSSIVWLVISGMPPFSFFWLKSFIVFSYLNMFLVGYAVLLSIIAVLAITSYFRSFHLRVKLTGISFYLFLPVSVIFISLFPI